MLTDLSTCGQRPAPMMPGRAIDIVMAAALQAGLSVRQVDYVPSHWEIELTLNGTTSEAAARLVFVALGVNSPDRGAPYGGQADLAAHVPALGAYLSVVVDELPPAPTVAPDVEALVAEVDAARTADAQQDVARTHGQPGHDGSPGTCPGCHAEEFGATPADLAG